MTREIKLKHFQDMLAQVQSHLLAREVDLEITNLYGLEDLDKIKAKSDKNVYVQSNKNYISEIKHQITADERVIAVIEAKIKSLESKKGK